MRSACILLIAGSTLLAQTDWPMYNHDIAGTRYSPLIQITVKNVAKLKQAWVYKLRSPSDAGKRFSGIGGCSEATPIVVNGVMYLPAGGRIVALQPETGKELWSYETKDGVPSRRGVTYWPGDKDTPPRIIFTSGRNKMALNAKTGKIVPGFGNEGIIDLVVPYDSAPTIYKNMLLVGANVRGKPAAGP